MAEKEQCEFCDEPISKGNEVWHEKRNGIRIPLCSEGCRLEMCDDERISSIEAREQFELYGDDMDSWFR